MIYEKSNSAGRNFLLFLGFIIIVVSIFFMVWMRSSIKSLEYKLGELQQRQHTLMKERRNLLAKKDNLLSIAAIDHVAIKKMGFAFPDRTRVIYVKDRI